MEKPELTGPTSLVGRTATDLGAAFRLALAVFPPSYQKRIVVVSDSNENKGHAVAEAELARAQGVVIDVLALKYDYPNEVWMEGLHLPTDLLPREPFDVTAVINSQQAGPARLSIFRNGELLSHQTVQLNKGKNVCPPNTYVGGWWMCTAYRGGGLCSSQGVRYYMDCNHLPGTGSDCRCANGNCGERRTDCNVFRYGQCNTQIGGVTPISPLLARFDNWQLALILAVSALVCAAGSYFFYQWVEHEAKERGMIDRVTGF